MTWCQSYGGYAVSFLTPDPRSISPRDIAVQLARQVRWNAATRVSYSIAQHSVHVTQIIRSISPSDYGAQLWAILHDAHEAYTGDMVSPFQEAVAYLMPKDWRNPITEIQDRLDRAIAERFGLPWNVVQEVKPLVRRADIIAGNTEAIQLLNTPPVGQWNKHLPPPDDVELLPVGAAQAEWLFSNQLMRCLEAYHGAQRGPELAA